MDLLKAFTYSVELDKDMLTSDTRYLQLLWLKTEQTFNNRQFVFIAAATAAEYLIHDCT